MEEILEVKFNGSAQELLSQETVKLAASEVDSAYKEGREPKLLTQNNRRLPWIPFSIKAKFGKKKKWYKCKFQIENILGEWFVQIEIDCKGSAVKKIDKLMKTNQEFLSQTIMKFMTIDSINSFWEEN